MTFSKEALSRKDIIPVIFVRGSNYEMGYQYGYQVGAGIVPVRDMKLGSSKMKIGENLDILNPFLKAFQY